MSEQMYHQKIMDVPFPKTVDKYDPHGHDSSGEYSKDDMKYKYEPVTEHECGCGGGCDHHHDNDEELLFDAPKLVGLLQSLLDDSSAIEEDFPFDIFTDDNIDASCDVLPPMVESVDDFMPSLAELLQNIDQGNNKMVVMKLSTVLENKIKTAKLNHVRMAFHYLNHANAENNKKAVSHLNKALRYASQNDEKHNIRKAIASAQSNKPEQADAGKYRLQSVFAANIPVKQTRTAYTTLSQQPGEQFLMCPKGVDFCGYPVATELSTCRDHCIDSRITKSGHISCGYRSWLEHVADSQEAALKRLETHRHPDNEENLITLKPGERTKGIEYLSMENMMNPDNAKVAKVAEPTLEKDHTNADAEDVESITSMNAETNDQNDNQALEELNAEHHVNKEYDDETLFALLAKDAKEMTNEEAEWSIEQLIRHSRGE